MQLKNIFEGDDEEFQSIWDQENVEVRNFKAHKIEDSSVNKLSNLTNQLEHKMICLNEHGIDPFEKSLDKRSEKSSDISSSIKGTFFFHKLNLKVQKFKKMIVIDHWIPQFKNPY